MAACTTDCYRMRRMPKRVSRDASSGEGARCRVSLLGRALRLARREGPLALPVAVVRRYVVDSRTYFLFEYDLWSEACMRLPPLPDEFAGCFVADNETADQLSEDHRDFRDHEPKARNALDSGAVAFCLYHGEDVAHVGWLTTSQKARRLFDSLGFEIRFDQGECWAGAVFTVPRFRNRGLLTYSALSRFAYLRDAGYGICRSAVETDNGASNSVQMRFDPRIYAVGHMFKLFGWRRWRERPPGAGESP